MTAPGSQEKGFLASLFDFGFTSFVTLRFLKVIYAIWVVLILIAGVAFLIAGFSSGTTIGVIGAIIFAPLITLLYIIGARIFFEIVAMFFRIGDNTYLAVQLLGGKPSGMVGQSVATGPGYGGSAQGPWPGVPAAPGAPAGQASPYGHPQQGRPEPSTYPQPGQPPSTYPPAGQPPMNYPPSSPPSSSQPQPGYGQATDQTRRRYPDSPDNPSTPSASS